jgi:hypothetical protein
VYGRRAGIGVSLMSSTTLRSQRWGGVLLTPTSGGVNIDGLPEAPHDITVTPNAGGVIVDA